MAGKAKVRHGDGEGVGKGEAEQDDEAVFYLLNPSLTFVAGLTLGNVIATATAVAKLRIKQFWAIRLAGKVVVPCSVMAMPLFLLHRGVESRSRTGERQESPAGAMDTGMKTFQEWLAQRTKTNEGLWLNDKNAVIGLSRLNPLPKNSAVNKSLAKGPAKAMPGVGVRTSRYPLH